MSRPLRRLVASALAALLPAAAASPDTQNGSLGPTLSATDFYQVTCSDDGSGPPASLIVAIEDAAPSAAPFVGVQAQRGLLVASTTDPVDADGAEGPDATVNGGGGVYDVLVFKTGIDSENYTLTFHCYTGPDGTGIHTGTSIVTRQNQ